jgi:hypothetical protein
VERAAAAGAAARATGAAARGLRHAAQGNACSACALVLPNLGLPAPPPPCPL